MQINYEDERFDAVKEAEKEELSEVEQTYGDMIGKAEDLYKEQISGIDKFTQQQQQFQQEQTDFAIEQLQQQKDKAQKDYIREQSGAYTDFKKQSGQYGAEAEQMAAAGLAGSGFSESSQVAMWNAYQSRVATARESFSQAVISYDNAMKDARMQGSAAMAEIALQGFQQQMELTLQGFQYENQLIQQMLGQKQQVQDRHYGRWQDVLAQLNQEAAMAEEQRQFDESIAFQQKEYEEGVRQFNEELAEQQRQFNEKMGIKTGGADNSGGNNTGEVYVDGTTQQPAVISPTGDFVSPVEPIEGLVAEMQENLKNNGLKIGLVGSLTGDGPQAGPLNNRAPSSVEGHGKLVDTQDTAEIKIIHNGKATPIEQPVRKAEDGTLWAWNPQTKKYIQVGTSGDWRRKAR